MKNFSDYIVYVDESGDANLDKISPTFPVFSLSFCIFQKDHYLQYVNPAVSKLKFDTFGHDMVILHERDIRKREGVFSSLSEVDRNNFLNGLTNIISNSNLTLIDVVIDKQAHKSKYCSPTEPYRLAMQFGLERLFDFASFHGFDDKITHVICESRGRTEDAYLKAAFENICSGSNRDLKPYPFQVQFVSKKMNSNGLQLADLTARPAGLYAMNGTSKNRTFPILVKKFWQGRRGCTFWGNGLKIFP